MSDTKNFFEAARALGAVEVLDVDAMRLAYRVERAGETFYEQLAARIGSDEAAALLLRNAREERGHAERIRRALGLKLGRPYEPAGADLEPYEIPLPPAVPLELLPAIVKGELDGDAGYQRWADREPDPEIQQLLRQNGREETVHGERVAAALEILRRARA